MTTVARVVGFVAREAPVAVLLRRGPTRWTAVIRWHLSTDELEVGDWLHGGIKPSDCDLSPDGELFVYFASYVRGVGPSGTEYEHDGIWTAVSRPPSLSPVIKWPRDDSWGGGGLFRDSRTLELRDRPENAIPGDSTLLDVHPTSGDLDLVRLERDGFEVVVAADESARFNARDWWDLWRKSDPSGAQLELRRTQAKYQVSVSYRYRAASGEVVDLTGFTWADFDMRQRVIGARRGELVTSPSGSGLTFEVVADLDALRPPDARP